MAAQSMSTKLLKVAYSECKNLLLHLITSSITFGDGLLSLFYLFPPLSTTITALIRLRSPPTPPSSSSFCRVIRRVRLLPPAEPRRLALAAAAAALRPPGRPPLGLTDQP